MSMGIGRLIEEIYYKDAEIARLNELLRGEGANRYWEERWRDDQNVVSILRAELSQERENHEITRGLRRGAVNIADALRAEKDRIEAELSALRTDVVSAEMRQAVDAEVIDHLRTELDAAKVNWQAVQKLKAELNEARLKVAVLRRRLL
jgi:hypothetical protein